jgi:hypothetical protein
MKHNDTHGVPEVVAPSWQAEAMARHAYERGCNAMRDRAILLIEARYESGHTCEPWVLVKELQKLDNPTDPAGVEASDEAELRKRIGKLRTALQQLENGAGADVAHAALEDDDAR